MKKANWLTVQKLKQPLILAVSLFPHQPPIKAWAYQWSSSHLLIIGSTHEIHKGNYVFSVGSNDHEVVYDGKRYPNSEILTQQWLRSAKVCRPLQAEATKRALQGDINAQWLLRQFTKKEAI